MTRAAIGSIAGSSSPRVDHGPNMRGAITIEQDLPAGTKLWLSAWSKQVAGADFISISAEIATTGGRNRARQGDSGRASEKADLTSSGIAQYQGKVRK